VAHSKEVFDPRSSSLGSPCYNHPLVHPGLFDDRVFRVAWLLWNKGALRRGGSHPIHSAPPQTRPAPDRLSNTTLRLLLLPNHIERTHALEWNISNRGIAYSQCHCHCHCLRHSSRTAGRSCRVSFANTPGARTKDCTTTTNIRNRSTAASLR